MSSSRPPRDQSRLVIPQHSGWSFPGKTPPSSGQRQVVSTAQAAGAQHSLKEQVLLPNQTGQCILLESKIPSSTSCSILADQGNSSLDFRPVATGAYWEHPRTSFSSNFTLLFLNIEDLRHN